MRDKTTITITTIDGSKSFTLGEFAKAAAVYAAIALLVVILIGAFSIYFLIGELENFDRLKEQHKALLMTSVDFKEAIEESNATLSELSEKIADIESIAGLSLNDEGKALPSDQMAARLDLARVGLAERMLTLRFVPSGVPIEYRGTTSDFGWRYHPLRRTQREFHTGIDLRARVGTPVYAAADGVVELTRQNLSVGYGNIITLAHAFGFKTLYAHLDRILVAQGAFIKKGQLIAYSGNTGYSNGPHLHYEVRYLNKPLDPTAFMEWDLKSYEAIFNKEKRVQWDSVAKGIAWQWTLLEQLSSQREPKLQAPSKLNASSISTDK
ncbi:MAG: M23 family metallopeptidase [Helicobacteraceae bacterium]|jgi:murein DD-endopeptidase MepM/ murein hydrolase activator NlpD|nr:M23 family metallopeptidase [Helicobacteraceae bacterium]